MAEDLRDVMSEDITEEISDRRQKKSSFRSRGSNNLNGAEGLTEGHRKEIYERNH